jgi:hypothetical protein
VAQGLLDYWKATLYTQLREAEVEPAAPCPTTTVLKDFPEDDSAKLVADAEACVTSLAPEDREVARRLLQRLARLESAVRELHPVAVPRAALDELGNVGQVVRVIHSLEKAGVIRSSITPLGEPRVELAAGHLIRTWPRYSEWLKERLAFRTAAYLWQQHNRHSSALTSGPTLAEASGYRDLDAVEGEFFHSSRRHEAHIQRVRTRGGFALLALAILVLLIVIILQWRVMKSDKANQSLRTQASELEEQKTLLEKRKAELEREQAKKTKRVTDINRMMRGLSEIVVAENSDYRQLTRWRWDQMREEVSADEEIRKVLKAREADLQTLLKSDSRLERGRAALAIAHEMRNHSLQEKDEWVYNMMLSVRNVTYHTAKEVTKELVRAASDPKKSIKDVMAYEREFWRLYWGPLGMVEGPQVESAMIAFGRALDDWKDWEQTKNPRWDQMRDRLAKLQKDLVAAFDADLKRPIELHCPQKR